MPRNATQSLVEHFTYRRPAGSGTERAYAARYLGPLGARLDACGNYVLRLGTEARPILWSSHTDTVHRTEGRQRVRVRDGHVALRGAAAVAQWARGDCLGADCGTGVWLMVAMARARIPGLYVWHYGEEQGCIGSSWARQHMPEVGECRAAIAFDRAGRDSIVTHQLGTRTCSDTFARSLADALRLPELAPDPTGVYTDTNEYADVIPECTNVSVGYRHQHSAHETQDLDFAEALLAAVLAAPWDSLAIERDPVSWGDWEADSESWGDEDADLDDTYARVTVAAGGPSGTRYCTLCDWDCAGQTAYEIDGHTICDTCWEDLQTMQGDAA